MSLDDHQAIKTDDTELNQPIVDTEATPENSQEEMAQEYHTEFKSTNFKEARPVIEPANEKKDIGRLALGTFGYPTQLTFSWTNGVTPKLNSEDYTSNVYHHAPMFLMDARLQSDVEWTQGIDFASQHIGIERAKYGNTGNLTGAAALEMVRRRAGNGTTIAFPLLRSCIWVTMRPASEQELADLDYRLSTDENSVGRSTAGMLLDAGSGTYSEALVDLALSLCVDSNITNRGEGLATALRKRIDVLDYCDLIAHMLIAQYPDGYPWEFACSNPQCNHVLTGQRVNFTRMLWNDKSALTDGQLTSLIKRRKAITDEEIIAYKADFKLTDKDVVTLPNANMIIHFKTASLDEYLTCSRAWVSSIEGKYTTSLTQYHSDQQRYAFIATQTQMNRFSKYLHLVDKITWEDCDAEITDPATISEALKAIDSTTGDFVTFEEAAISFIEAHSITVFGYPSQPCTVCKVEPETSNGRFTSIVPVSPDRTFFTLAQLKTMAMSKLGEE